MAGGRERRRRSERKCETRKAERGGRLLRHNNARIPSKNSRIDIDQIKIGHNVFACDCAPCFLVLEPFYAANGHDVTDFRYGTVRIASSRWWRRRRGWHYVGMRSGG